MSQEKLNFQRSLTRFGTILALIVISAGFAVASGYFQFSGEQAAARREARGIWAGEFEKPSQWRREHRAADIETPAAGFLTVIRHLLGWSHG